MLDITDPHAIEARSMRIIDEEVPEPRPFEGGEWSVVRRMIHTSADFEMLQLVRFHPRAVRAGVAALAAGCRIVTDTEMARAGIPLRRVAPLGGGVDCFMNHPEVVRAAKEAGTTRAKAAIELLAKEQETQTEGAPALICVVGNAPTALIRLVEMIREGRLAPALVVGMPVGFVNAAESKDLLMELEDTPWIAIHGRKGGSALAASAINALADMALVETAITAKPFASGPNV